MSELRPHAESDPSSKEAIDVGKLRRAYSWVDIANLTHRLKQELDIAGFKPQGIIAVSRGGLMPATLLAHKYDLRNLQMLVVHSYDTDDVQTELHPLFVPKIPSRGHHWLVVDDICDSGETQEFIRRLWPLAMRVCLIQKLTPASRTRGTPHLRAEFVEPNIWVEFPWEA